MSLIITILLLLLLYYTNNNNNTQTRFKGGVGCVRGMLEHLVLAACTIIEIFVILWGLSQLNKTIYDASDELEEKLDGKLAAVIQQYGLGGEPINPIQAAIGELLKNAANGNKAGQVIDLRSANGQFEKKD